MHSLPDNFAERVDVCVVGSGASGMVAALLLAQVGIKTALVGKPTPDDPRTTTLMQGALGVLEQIGVWESLVAHSAPLRTMRIIDATRRLIRAPDVIFNAAECGLDAFGYNIPNSVLLNALREAVLRSPDIAVIEDNATCVLPHTAYVEVTFSEGCSLQARLVVGADGRHSLCRTAAGIRVTEHLLEQTAFVVNVANDKPHHGVSTEFHTETGPFTVVPLPERLHTSIVAVVKPDQADALMAMNTAALGTFLAARCGRFLGEMMPVSTAGARRLLTLKANTIAANRIALVGEAAHIFPPIGAQGLNLGVRDAAALVDIVKAAALANADLGGEPVIAAYNKTRRFDIFSRSFAVNALNQSLLSPLLPAHVFRSAGLSLLSSIPPLRQAAMRIGMGVPFYKKSLRSL